jgi:hypothetical protein
MKRVLAVVTGIVLGVLAAGLLAPAAVAASQGRLRGAAVLWTITALGIAAGVWIALRASRSRRE